MKIAVAGTGYVGLSLATLLAQKHEVYALDVIPEKVEMINNRISPIKDEKIEELDETYLYAAYIATTKETFTNILTSLGYENLESFLISKEYVDKNGKASLYVWCIENMEEMSLIMKQASETKGMTK